MSLVIDYTTTVPVKETVGDILDLLPRYGARNVALDYDAAGAPTAVTFIILTKQGPLRYRQGVDRDRVLARLRDLAEERDASNKRRLPLNRVTVEHAERVGWRILRDWLKAQLALIHIGLASLEEVFLPYQLIETTGGHGQQTFFDAWQHHRALPSPQPSPPEEGT